MQLLTPKNAVLTLLGGKTTGLDAQAKIPARLTGDEHEGFRFHDLSFATEAQRRREIHGINLSSRRHLPPR
jgi:hypothetical protein